MDYIKQRNAVQFASLDPEDYFNCPKCGLQTVVRNSGVACDVCGSIEDMILANIEAFEKAQAAPQKTARVAAKG